MFIVLAVQALLILTVINAARKRRAKCDWQPGTTTKKMWLATVGVVIGLVLPILNPAPNGSPVGIFYVVLVLYSVFMLSQALYRKADLRKSTIAACFEPASQAGPVHAETPEAKAFHILTGKTLAEVEGKKRAGAAVSKNANELLDSEESYTTIPMNPYTNERKLGWNWLWFLPLCGLVLVLVERHTVLNAWWVLKLGYGRWRWLALLSPSADFCISAILFSVWWPFWGLTAVYGVFTAENENTIGKRYLYVFLIAAAVLLLLPFVSDALIWGSFPFSPYGHLRLIPFIPWPGGAFGEY